MLPFNFAQFIKPFIFFVFVALIVLLPSLHFMPGYLTHHDGHRLLMLLLLVLTMLYSLTSKQNYCNKLVINAKIRYGFFALLVLACISSYLSKAPRHAIIEMSIFAGLSYLALFVAEQFQQQGKAFTKQLVSALWVGVLLYLFAFYVAYITAGVFKTPLIWPRPLLGFNNPRFFNQYQLWCIGLICLPMLAEDVSTNTKRWLSVALTLWWVLLFYSASRGVLLAWLAASVITLAFYKKSAWPFLRLQISTLIAGLVSFFALFKLIPILIGTQLVTGDVLRDTTSDRLELWFKAFHLTVENPIFGVGPMNFPWYNLTSFHPHNTILQLSSEWGIPATLIIIGIVGYGAKNWLKKFNLTPLKTKSNYDLNLSIILFFTVVTNGIYSMVDGVIVMPMSQVLMLTVIGLMIGQYCSANNQELVETNKLNILKIKLGFRPIFAAVVIVSLVWSNLPEIRQGLSGYKLGFSTGAGKINPRIWINIRSAPS